MRLLLNGDYLLKHILSFERHPPGNHFIEHNTQAPDVSTIVEALQRQRLLGRHVTHCAHHNPGLRLKQRARSGSLDFLLDGFCEAEVEHLHDGVAAPQHDVFRFDIAMNYVRFMRRIEGRGDLDADVEHFVEIQTLGVQVLSQRHAFNVFHRHETC